MSAPVPSGRRGPFARLMALLLIALPFLLGIIMPKDQDLEKQQLDQAIALGHEPRDLPPRGILAFGIALLIVMGLVLVVATATNILLLGHLPSAPIPPANLQNAPIPTLPPAPVLEAEPGQQLQQLRSEEDKLLHSYGWVDQKAGIVHIPIDRAMDILAQRGLPVRPTPQAKFEDNGQQSASYPSSGRVMEPYP
jgi:hypothetical protein